MPHFSSPFTSSFNQQSCNSSSPDTSSFSTPLPVGAPKAGPFLAWPCYALGALWGLWQSAPRQLVQMEQEDAELMRKEADSPGEYGSLRDQGTLRSCLNSVRHSERVVYGVLFHDMFLILQSMFPKLLAHCLEV